MVFVGTVTTEAATTQATTFTTGMNFYSVLNTYLLGFFFNFFLICDIFIEICTFFS
jgi:hypothetical protein